ncbi:hypothetical protein BpHYR1_007288 [Brachionus plicatilis]|uniref:Uncharacterized protein n=1 Tax=Brachionus plicatilis TaxID=10195 RepID=A0A3M7Q401_BRAPC|nr:hypothetical protein BpHYR1_007288 [Brachionus plicatilis]
MELSCSSSTSEPKAEVNLEIFLCVDYFLCNIQSCINCQSLLMMCKVPAKCTALAFMCSEHIEIKFLLNLQSFADKLKKE